MASNNDFQFLKQFEYLTFIQVKENHKWCRDNTDKIKAEAIFLEQLLFRVLKSEKMKRKNVKKLFRKMNKWKMFHKIYGLRNENTIKCFKKVIYYIEKYEDYAQENGDAYDDEVSGDTDYEGYEDDGYGDIVSYQDDTADESTEYDNEFLTELKRYPVLLADVQQWLRETQTAISRKIKLTSEKVRGQIRDIKYLEQDLCALSVQLEHLLTGVQKLVGERDVQSLANDMISNLGSVRFIMEEAHQCLGLRLQQLREILKTKVIGYPEGADIQKDLADTSLKEETFDDGEVVDENLMNVEDELSSAEPKDFKMRPPLLEDILESTSGKILITDGSS